MDFVVNAHASDVCTHLRSSPSSRFDAWIGERDALQSKVTALDQLVLELHGETETKKSVIEEREARIKELIGGSSSPCVSDEPFKLSF